jgi:copper chaperone CopZ
MKTEIQIGGMSCQHCVKAVDRALRGLEGVESVEVGVGTAVLTTTEAPDMDSVRRVIEEEGFRLI